MNALKLCVLVLACAPLACPPTPTPPGPDADAAPVPSDAPLPVSDSSPASAVVQACANLQAAGCSEGEPTCPRVLQDALDSRISKKVTPPLVACVAAAGSLPTTIRACGAGWCDSP